MANRMYWNVASDVLPGSVRLVCVWTTGIMTVYTSYGHSIKTTLVFYYWIFKYIKFA